MKRIVSLLLGLAVVALMAASAVAQTTDTDDVSVFVTPSEVNVSINADPSTYGFGDMVLSSTATEPWDGIPARLTNDGSVNVRVSKRITEDGLAGTPITSTTTWKFADNYTTDALGTDWYKLWSLAKAGSDAPAWGEYTTGAGSVVADSESDKFAPKGTYNQVIDADTGQQLELGFSDGLTASTSIWFALEMPGSVSTLEQREMLITFEVEAQ